MKDSTKKATSPSAANAGTITLGDELTVNRLGFGAMRLTGDGIWGPPKDRTAAIAVLLTIEHIERLRKIVPIMSVQNYAADPRDLLNCASCGKWVLSGNSI